MNISSHIRFFLKYKSFSYIETPVQLIGTKRNEKKLYKESRFYWSIASGKRFWWLNTMYLHHLVFITRLNKLCCWTTRLLPSIFCAAHFSVSVKSVAEIIGVDPSAEYLGNNEIIVFTDSYNAGVCNWLYSAGTVFTTSECCGCDLLVPQQVLIYKSAPCCLWLTQPPASRRRPGSLQFVIATIPSCY